AHVLVEQVVSVLPAKLVERLGGLALGLGHEITPHRSIRQLHFGNNRAIGVNVVAAVQKKIGLAARHRLVDSESAEFGIDSPALSDLVTGPKKANVARARRRRAKSAAQRFTHRSLVPQVLEADFVMYGLPRGQAREFHAARVISRVDAVRS